MATSVRHEITCADIKDKLIQTGAVTLGDSGVDGTGDAYTSALLDMRKCDPAGWDNVVQKWREDGVLPQGDVGDEQLEDYALCPVQFRGDGNCMTYYSAWDMDARPARFASAVLKDDVLSCKSFVDGKLDWNEYLKSGLSCTPSGKPCYAKMDVVASALKDNPKNNDQVMVRFHYGKGQKDAMFYVDKNDIERTQGYNGKDRACVYLGHENYRVYGIEPLPKVLSAQGILSGYETARSAFRESMAAKQSESPVTSKQTRGVPNDLDAVMQNTEQASMGDDEAAFQ